MKRMRIVIILLIIITLIGCVSEINYNNEVNNVTNIKNNDEVNSPITIHVRDYYGVSWSSSGVYSILLDSSDSKLYIMKEDKIVSIFDDFNYQAPILSADGKHFISMNVEELKQNRKYIFYLFNTETIEKELYTELDIALDPNNNHNLSSIFWDNERIYAVSTVLDENYNLLNNDLILVSASGEMEVVWANCPPTAWIADIRDDWVLYFEHEKGHYAAYNLSTKKTIEYETLRTSNGLNNYQNLKFLEAPTKIVGSKTPAYEENYIFIYNHESGKNTKIYDEVFIGFSTLGFAYGKYTGNENEYYIYIKPWSFQ